MSNLTEELTRLLGEDKFFVLVEHYGGCRLYIPNIKPNGSRVQAAIGDDAAEKLVRYFGNTTIRVLLARNQRIKRYRHQGYTIAAIAQKLVMTESGVERALSRAKKDKCLLF
ncbi:hypothetical protein [uncultured Bartonella sp.]|uniref:hypothetical protein n=1 Tax=uncultured Bartonella sp. TaxID=104108 RepID=UPI0026281579|nr:hypothetical protein [uncultured Bartonella sp.]